MSYYWDNWEKYLYKDRKCIEEKYWSYYAKKKIENILNGKLITMKDLLEDLDINDLTYFKYASITSIKLY